MKLKCDRSLEEGNHGKIVAIDIETGIFEVADEILTATDRSYRMAQIYVAEHHYLTGDTQSKTKEELQIS